MAKKSKKLDQQQEATSDPRYPIGEVVYPAEITVKDINAAIDKIAELPRELRHALRKLNDKKLDPPYREGGWTVRTLVHHIADSHMVAFHRVRKALTEKTPLVTDYEEQRFAELADSAAPIEWSLDILEGVHARWVMMLRSLTEEQLQRRFNHMTRGMQTLAQATVLYAWHSQHHLAHITTLRTQKDR